jgi:hypothetical protein
MRKSVKCVAQGFLIFAYLFLFVFVSTLRRGRCEVLAIKPTGA